MDTSGASAGAFCSTAMPGAASLPAGVSPPVGGASWAQLLVAQAPVADALLRSITVTAASGPQPEGIFVAAAEKELAESSVEIAQISWVNATYITDEIGRASCRERV